MNLPTHFPKNRRFYLLLGGNLVVLVLIGTFVVRPVVGLLVNHTNEIVKTRAEVAAIQQKTADLRKLKETYPAYAETYAPLLTSLPPTKDVAGYQASLEDLARLTSNQLQMVDTASKDPKSGAQPAVQVGGFPVIPVKVDLTGTFATVLDFISRVETMDRFTRVTGLDIKATDGAGGVKATIQLQTLYQPGKNS